MAENITVNMENLNEEERKQLVALIEKANKPKSKVWIPGYGEEYWRIDAEGFIHKMESGCSEYDDCAFAIGNYFENREKAKLATERLKVIQQLKELGGYYESDVTNKVIWYISINPFGNTIEPRYTRWLNGTVCFKTEQEAKNAIKVIGEERLNKHYFCIED